MGEALRVWQRVAEADLASLDYAQHAHDLAAEEWAQAQQRRFLGKVAMASEVEVTPEQSVTLQNAIDRAAGADYLDKRYDAAAHRLVDINIGSATVEGVFKVGHYTAIPLEKSETDELIQFGQTTEQIHYNSLAYRPHRTEAQKQITYVEALNGWRIENLHRMGATEENVIIVPSLVPDNLSEKELGEEGDGYFLRTMTYAVQATSVKEGVPVVESYFNAGVDEKFEDLPFEERRAKRHDLQAIQLVYKRLGLLPPETTLEALHAIVVPKSLLPNGVIDFVRMCDEATDRLQGIITPRTVKQYNAIIEQSKQREDSLDGIKADIKAELLKHAGTFTNPMEPIDLLWDLVKQHAYVNSLENEFIDPRAFGAGAAEMVVAAREEVRNGNLFAAQMLMVAGAPLAVISGCGGGSKAARRLAAKLGLVSSEMGGTSDEDDEEDEEDRSSWIWTLGVCQVDVCPSRPGRAWVGPCEVCTGCQELFDAGKDPFKVHAKNKS